MKKSNWRKLTIISASQSNAKSKCPQKNWYLLNSAFCLGRKIGNVLKMDLVKAFPDKVQKLNADDLLIEGEASDKGKSVKKQNGYKT